MKLEKLWSGRTCGCALLGADTWVRPYIKEKDKLPVGAPLGLSLVPAKGAREWPAWQGLGSASREKHLTGWRELSVRNDFLPEKVAGAHPGGAKRGIICENVKKLPRLSARLGQAVASVAQASTLWARTGKMPAPPETFQSSRT